MCTEEIFNCIAQYSPSHRQPNLRDSQYRLLNRALVTDTDLIGGQLSHPIYKPSAMNNRWLQCACYWHVKQVKQPEFIPSTLIYKTATANHFHRGRKIASDNTVHLSGYMQLIVKQYIYACRCQKSKPKINVLLEKSIKLNYWEYYRKKKSNQVHRYEKK